MQIDEIEKVTDEEIQYSKPQIEEIELNEDVEPEMAFTARAGMGNCKHTYV